MKKLLFFLCILILAFSFALAEEPEWVYSANAGGIGRYNGPGGDVVVPETAEGEAVRALGSAVFSMNADITGLTVPGCVRSLGSSTVNGCANLERVTLADGLQAIEYNNFSSLPKLTELTIPSTVVLIDYSVSWCDNLRTVTFLGECPVFSNPDFCFSVLPSDLTVYVPDDQVEAYRAALINLNPDQIQPSGQNAIVYDYVPTADQLGFDAGVITAYSGDSLRVDLPAELGGVPVTAIGEGAFADTPLVIVNIPKGVTEIGDYAFDGADDLRVISMPDSLRRIGDYAFNSTEANMITWSRGLEEIGAGAFRYTSIGSELELPASLQVIGSGAFKGASLRDAHIGGAIRSIGEEAFARTNLNYLQLDVYEMIEVGADAFTGTWLEDVDLPWDSDQQNQLAWQALIDGQVEGCKVWINNPEDCDLPTRGSCTYGEYPDGTLYVEAYTGDQEALVLYHTMDGVQVTGIGDGAFKGNQTLKKYRVTHNDTFKTIGAEAFAGSAVETVDLYYTTETLGDGAFRDCVGLTSIVLPESLRSVGRGAFAGCVNLRDVTILCDPSILPQDAFAGTAYAQASLIEMPMAANAESDFDFDSETGTITEYLGTGVDVVIPREIGGVPVKAIGYHVFDRCRVYADTDMVTNQVTWQPLRAVVIPETVEIVADSAFEYCQQLELVICYAPLKSTGRATFLLCRNLKDVVFVNGVEEIDNYAFESTEALRRVYWGDHLRRIGVNAFNRTGLEALVIDAEIVDEGAFNHSALTSVALTDRVREVRSAAFYACENLTSIACQFSEAERFVEGGPFGGIPQTGVTTLFPADTTPEQLNRLNGKLNIWNGGHLGSGNEITLTDVEAQPAEMPDAERLYMDILLSATVPVAPEPEPEAPIVLPDPIGDADRALGLWKVVAMVEDGEEIDISGFGLDMSLRIDADGTAVMDMGGDAQSLRWEMEDGILWIGTEDEYLPVGLDENGRLILVEGEGSMLFVRQAAEEAPAAGAYQTEIKYMAVTYCAAGYTLDAAMLGAEYSLILHANGQCDMMTGGMSMPTMTWAENGDGSLTLDYMGALTYTAVLNGGNIDVDLGGMVISYAPQE